MLIAISEFIHNSRIIPLWLVSTFLWWAGGAIILGLPELMVKKQKAGSFRWDNLRDYNFHRPVSYRWELIFAAIHLGVLTGVFFILQDVGTILFPNYPVIMSTFLGYTVLFFIFFAKMKHIWSRPPSGSFLESARYLYGGFVNPFRSVEVHRLGLREGEDNDER